MYTVDNTTATSATLPHLQCNTEYTIWVYASVGTSAPGMISLPTRGLYFSYYVVGYTIYHPPTSCSAHECLKWHGSGLGQPS